MQCTSFRSNGSFGGKFKQCPGRIACDAHLAAKMKKRKITFVLAMVSAISKQCVQYSISYLNRKVIIICRECAHTEEIITNNIYLIHKSFTNRVLISLKSVRLLNNVTTLCFVVSHLQILYKTVFRRIVLNQCLLIW